VHESCDLGVERPARSGWGRGADEQTEGDEVTNPSHIQNEVRRRQLALLDRALIRRGTWNDYIAGHEPPYTPGIWHALLVALSNSVRH